MITVLLVKVSACLNWVMNWCTVVYCEHVQLQSMFVLHAALRQTKGTSSQATQGRLSPRASCSHHWLGQSWLGKDYWWIGQPIGMSAYWPPVSRSLWHSGTGPVIFLHRWRECTRCKHLCREAAKRSRQFCFISGTSRFLTWKRQRAASACYGSERFNLSTTMLGGCERFVLSVWGAGGKFELPQFSGLGFVSLGPFHCA